MFVSVSLASSATFDLCIIGAGPAGIILALEVAEKSPQTKILLVEAGLPDTTVNPLDETIKITNEENHHLPYNCTNKGLGGSSISWGGRCVMYDEVDFLPHGPVQGQCTWGPDFLQQVAPFLEKTGDYFRCGSGHFSLSEIGSGQHPPITENFASGSVTDDRLERWSLPTRFGKEYRDRLESSSQISVLQGHIAHAFSTLDSNSKVSHATISSIHGGDQHQVHASRFVICAGGQESTRLLLKSPQLFNHLSAPPSSLGRFYQGHVSGKIANIKFYGDPEQTKFAFEMDGEVYCRRRFQFNTSTLLDKGLLNIAFWLDTPPFHDAAHQNGTLSVIYLAMICPILRKRLMPPAIAQSITSRESRNIFPHLKNILLGLPGSFLTPAMIFIKRYLKKRSLPGVYLKSKSNRYALHFHSEQTPREENRMSLDEKGETLRIDFGYSAEDIDSVILGHKLLDQSLRAMNCGELEYLYPEDQLPAKINHLSMDGLHQVGTTRIAASAHDGVVNSDLLVFGTSNLYVCSSSVFPTSSQANPTFLLGACALRLAHHLVNQRAETNL